MAEFFTVDFWRSFTSETLATFLGAIFGIPAGLWLERWRARATLQERRRQLLVLLGEALEKNRGLVEQMQREVKPDRVIFYNVDITVFDATASLKFELISNPDLNTLLERIRYELQHLHRKVNLQLEITYSTFRAMGDYPQVRAEIIKAISAHIDPIKTSIDQALSLLQKELQI